MSGIGKLLKKWKEKRANKRFLKDQNEAPVKRRHGKDLYDKHHNQ